MVRISINNGHSYVTAAEALKEMSMGAIVEMMVDEIREQVHNDIAPCTDEEFLEEYLRRAPEDLIIG